MIQALSITGRNLAARQLQCKLHFDGASPTADSRAKVALTFGLGAKRGR